MVLPTIIFSDLDKPFASTTEEKQQIQLLLKQYLRAERREEIYENFKIAQIEQQTGKLKFSAHMNELRQLIEEYC